MASRIYGLMGQLKYTAWASIFRRDLLQPTYTINNFAELEIPLHTKLVILDKDNCFAKPHTTEVWPAFQGKWQQLIKLSKKQCDVCVLSNTAGDAANDPTGELARALEERTGVRVLRHKEKKPMCYAELRTDLPYKPEDILVVGDRLVTDILLANLMGAKSTWVRPGLHPSFFNRLEMAFKG